MTQQRDPIGVNAKESVKKSCGEEKASCFGNIIYRDTFLLDYYLSGLTLRHIEAPIFHCTTE